eukprot:TRINITY_DN3447_c1_g1_i1.p1 TRINITY_DN3447_c1_g1~~TRINITY_DN3447_c1_g1_i1.p1  ORF type:complete len:997 (+),score=215.44 TRINITY_DN3447_c1_g1_i1:236-3226(+)
MSGESSPSSRRKAATQSAAPTSSASPNPTSLNTSGSSIPRGSGVGSSSPGQDKKKKRGSTPKQSASTPTETHRTNGNSSEENPYDSTSTSEPEVGNGGGSSDGGALPVSSSIHHRAKLNRRSSSSLSASGDNSSPSRRPSSKTQSSSSKSTTTSTSLSSGKRHRTKPSKDAAQDSAATDSVVEFYMQGDDPMAHSLEWDSATSDSDSSAVSGRTPSPHTTHITANPAVPRLRRASSAAQGPVPSHASPSKSPRRDHSSRSLKSPREKDALGAADPLEEDGLVSSLSSLSLDDSSGNSGNASPASVINAFLEELGLGGGVSPLPASASHEVFFKESGDSAAVQSSAEQQPTPSSQISHATVGGLMSLLANPQSFQDKSFIDTFILSYEYFMDSPTFLKRLMGLYFVPQSSGGTSPTDDPAAQQQQRLFFQLRVINVLKKLIETRYFALRRDKRCYQLLRSFLRVLLKCGDDREKSLVAALRQSMKQNGEFFRAADNPNTSGTDSQSSSLNETSSNSSQTSAASSATAALVSNPGIPFSLGPQKTLLDYTHKDLARHLTLIEFEFWSSIKLDEFYHTAFSSKEKDKLAPNVNRFIKRFNDVSAWVASSVVLAPKKKQRVAVLTRLIQIMDELRRIRNFNGMMAFFSALSLGAIQRLKKTWKEVPSKVMQLWTSASKFMDSSGGYKVYKEFIHIADPPTIPYMGFILRDLDFAEEFPTWVARDGRPDEDASSSSDTETRTKSSKSSASKNSPTKTKKVEDPSHLGRTGANKYVNWTKMQWLAQCFGDTLRFQRTKFPFEEVKEMAEFVGDLSRHSWFLSDAELNEMSRNIEPEPNDAAVVAAALQPPDGSTGSSPNSPSSKPKDKSARTAKKKEKKIPQYEDLIRDPQLFSDFRKHLESRFNSENLLFWESVYKFKTTVDFTDALEVKRRADEILHKFVTGTAENSRYMVGLNSSVSRDIKRQVDKGDITPIIFDRAVDEVEHVTLRPAFQDMLRAMGH